MAATGDVIIMAAVAAARWIISPSISYLSLLSFFTFSLHGSPRLASPGQARPELKLQPHSRRSLRLF